MHLDKKKKKAVNLQALAFKNDDFCLFIVLGPTSVTSGLFFHGFWELEHYTGC